MTQRDSVCVAKPASGRTVAPINGRGMTWLKWEVGSGEGGGMGGITTDEDAPFKNRPLSRAHAHTTVSPAGSQVLEGREPVEHAGLDARYRVVVEPPRGGER